MAIREFAVESMLYRTAALIDQAIEVAGFGTSAGDAVLAALEEFAIEASILKVAGSEMIDYAVDENVQIHGGNGFVRDYPAERMYRDARVNRIFEGTNEINRLLIPGMLIRRALKGALPLIPAAKKLQDEILTPSLAEPPSDEPLENARRTVAALKKVSLMVLGTAMQTYGEKLTDQQELLTLSADIIIDVFAGESVVLRAMRMPAHQSALGIAAAEVYVSDAAGRDRDRRAIRARGDGRRRHAADAPRCATAAPEACAGQHGRPAAPDRRCDHRAQGLSLRVITFLTLRWGPPPPRAFMAGARRRDLAVAEAKAGTPSACQRSLLARADGSTRRAA